MFACAMGNWVLVRLLRVIILISTIHSSKIYKLNITLVIKLLGAGETVHDKKIYFIYKISNKLLVIFITHILEI